MNKLTKKYYHLAVELALLDVEKEARKILREHSHLEEFVMAMGSWCFWTTDGGQVDNYYDFKYLKPLVDIFEEWDEYLKLTGTPMRFTANGKKVTYW
jgi:hypothetical protein